MSIRKHAKIITLEYHVFPKSSNNTVSSLIGTETGNTLMGFVSLMCKEKKQMRPFSDCLRSSVPAPRPSQSFHTDSKYLTMNLST